MSTLKKKDISKRRVSARANGLIGSEFFQFANTVREQILLVTKGSVYDVIKDGAVVPGNYLDDWKAVFNLMRSN